MRLLKTDVLRVLTTIALLVMLGSASTCRADFQVALSDQQANDLTVAISTLQATLTKLESSLRSLSEAAVKASPADLDLAAEEFDKSASAYYTDSFSFEEFAFQEMASFKPDSLEAENVKSLILSEKMLDVSVANVYTAVACYYERNDTSVIVNAVEASMESLQGFSLSLSMYSAGETLIEIPTPPSLALVDPDGLAREVAEKALEEMDRIVAKAAEVDTYMELQIIRQLIYQAIDWILSGKTPEAGNYWLQKALNFVHKTIRTIIDFIGATRVAEYLYDCAEKIINRSLYDITEDLIRMAYNVGGLRDLTNRELNRFLEAYQRADPSQNVKNRINERFDQTHQSITSAYYKFADTAEKAKWIGGIVNDVLVGIRWLIRNFTLRLTLTAFAIGLDVVIITYVTWDGYDYIDMSGKKFYNRKEGVVELALNAFDEACKMLEGRTTLSTYCKFVSVNDGPWMGVNPGQKIPASEGDPVKVYYRVSWPEEIITLLLLGPLEVRIWESSMVAIISPLNSTSSSPPPTWEFNISYGETIELEPKRVLTISSLPESLSTTIEEGPLTATFMDWPEFSWLSAIMAVIEESEITCTLSKSTIPVGMAVKISGSVTPAHLTPVAIEHSRDGGTTWLPLDSINSEPDGSFSYLWAPPSTGTYLVRATWAGDYDHKGATSPHSTLVVTKYPSMISCSAHPREAKRGKPITLSGTLYPAHAGVSITLTYTRPDGSNITRVVEAEHDGSFSDVYVPDVEGLWRVKASWLGDDDHEGSESPTQTFTVSSIYLTISTPYKDAQLVTVNGSPYTTDAHGRIRIALEGAGVYLMEAKTPLSIGEGVRAVFASWNGRFTENPLRIRIDDDTVLTTVYKIQYLLTVLSPYSEAEGGGWYDANSTAPFSVAPTLIDCGNGTRRVFTAWTGDLTIGSSSATILMDSPKTVMARWKTQYYLAVKSAHGEPEGGGWYDAGLTATFSVMTPVGFIVQQAFTGWSGDSTATTPSSTIVMDAPKAVISNWRTDYTQLIMIVIGVAVGSAITTVIAKRKRRTQRN